MNPLITFGAVSALVGVALYLVPPLRKVAKVLALCWAALFLTYALSTFNFLSSGYVLTWGAYGVFLALESRDYGASARSARGWALASVFLGPLVVIAFIGWQWNKTRIERRDCPMCLSEIDARAVRCPRCTELVPPVRSVDEPASEAA